MDTQLIYVLSSWVVQGTAYEYSNLGFVILGRVIQNATGRNFREVVSDKILKPLGMMSTVWVESGLDNRRVARGYARLDDQGHAKGPRAAMAANAQVEWVEQQVQGTGTFAALGGLYSSV